MAARDVWCPAMQVPGTPMPGNVEDSQKMRCRLHLARICTKGLNSADTRALGDGEGQMSEPESRHRNKVGKSQILEVNRTSKLGPKKGQGPEKNLYLGFADRHEQRYSIENLLVRDDYPVPELEGQTSAE